MSRCVIVGGADIENYDRVINSIDKDDFMIYCDSGLKHTERIGHNPDLIIGDFDSHKNPHLDVETIVLPVVKDDTDTVYAAKEALKRGFDDYLLTGVIGQRFDHSMGNIGILIMLTNQNKKAAILDDWSKMEIVKDKPAFIDDSYSYFSLLAISKEAKGVTIKNAKYELSDGRISPDYQYGVSNEVTPGKLAEVSVSEGELLLVKVF